MSAVIFTINNNTKINNRYTLWSIKIKIWCTLVYWKNPRGLDPNRDPDPDWSDFAQLPDWIGLTQESGLTRIWARFFH